MYLPDRALEVMGSKRIWEFAVLHASLATMSVEEIVTVARALLLASDAARKAGTPEHAADLGELYSLPESLASEGKQLPALLYEAVGTGYSLLLATAIQAVAGPRFQMTGDTTIDQVASEMDAMNDSAPKRLDKAEQDIRRLFAAAQALPESERRNGSAVVKTVARAVSVVAPNVPLAP